MSVNLIQMKLEKTYHSGVFRERPTTVYFAEEATDSARPVSSPTYRATLGILQGTTTDYSAEAQAAHAATKQMIARACQTLISFPVTRQTIVTREGNNNPSVRLLKPKQRSLTNLLQPAKEIQQQDIVRTVMAGANDAAAVLIFMSDTDRRRGAPEYFFANDMSHLSVPSHSLTFAGSNIRAGESRVLQIDANRNESLTSIDDLCD
jgi:hypothetical protein